MHKPNAIPFGLPTLISFELGLERDIIDAGSQGMVSVDVELQVVALREVERRCRIAFLHDDGCSMKGGGSDVDRAGFAKQNPPLFAKQL
jgi:hypothetical protein